MVLVQDLAEGFAGDDGLCVEVEERFETVQEGGHAAGVVEVGHVVVAAWFEVD